MEEKEEKQETVTQPEKKTEETVTESVEKTEKVNEKTFTQDEVNAMLAKEKKKMPSSEELKAFKEWKENPYASVNTSAIARQTPRNRMIDRAGGNMRR